MATTDFTTRTPVANLGVVLKFKTECSAGCKVGEVGEVDNINTTPTRTNTSTNTSTNTNTGM